MPKVAQQQSLQQAPQDIQAAAQNFLKKQGKEAESLGAPPPEQEFNYKTSKVNSKGESLPAGAVSWTPFGQPYFGAGISGTIKKYAHMMMGSPSQGPDNDRWAKFLDLTSTNEFWSDPTSDEFKEAGKQMLGGAFGTQTTQETSAVDLQKAEQAKERLAEIGKEYRGPNGVNLNAMPEEVKAEYEELRKTAISTTASGIEGKTSFTLAGQNISLLSPLVKGTKVALSGLMDVLSEASVKVEQTLGAQQAMREYANENDAALPDLAFDVNREESGAIDTDDPRFWEDPAYVLKSEEAQNITNIASRLLVAPLAAWDALRFWTAPGTREEKQAALKEGFDAGRVLYSQAIKPALLEEFKRRAAAGEDPQLLAQELANPWAELAGQVVLDPLNLIGALAKGAKVVGQIDKATDMVRGGALGDEAVELFSDSGKMMSGPLGETRAAERMEKFDGMVTKTVQRVEKDYLTSDLGKATSYSPQGLRTKATKTVMDTTNIAISSIMRNGGGADEVADFFHYVAKATDADKATRMEAWDNIFTLSQRFGMGRYAFSDDIIQTGVLLRNVTNDKGLLTALKAGNGDLQKTAEILSRKFDQAIEKQIPTFGQVKKGAEAFKAGTDTSAEAEKLAKQFESLSESAKAKWMLHEGAVGKFKTAVNSFLGKFYFSAPGFVARNASSNMTTMVIDLGFSGTAKSFYRDGKYWSIADIDDDLMKYFGGKMPSSAVGMSLAKSEKAESFITKANDAVEASFAKRIYWSRFRDTMDKFMRPGVGLPSRDQFKALGMADEAIDHFTHVLKNETYGNVEQAIVKYSEKFGEDGLMDVWKRWNGSLSPEEMKGLDEINLTKQLDEITNTAKTPQEIRDRIGKLKTELQNRAATATDNPVGVNRERAGFEFMEDTGKAAKQGYINQDDYSKINILIEQSEKYSDELAKAIGKARDTITDPAMREQFNIMEDIFSAERRAAPRTAHKSLNDAAWSFTNRSKKGTGLDAEKMWNESILAKRGPAPKGMTGEQFRTELWNATRDDIAKTWESHFAEGFDRLQPLIDNLTEQYPEMQTLFAKSQKASSELQMYRTANYRGGKIFYSKPPQNIAELASRYGVSSATEAGVPRDKQLLNTINKYSETKYKTLDEVPMPEAEKALQKRMAEKSTEVKKAKVVKTTKQPQLMEKAIEMPRGELPPEVSVRFEDEARQMMDELSSGTGPQVSQPRQGQGGETVRIPSTNINWYRELPRNLQNKKTLNAALEKIIKDKGSDKGVNVERLKEMILDRFKFGNPTTGTPPDLKVLQGLGADQKTLQNALDEYNDITKQQLSLDEVLSGTKADEAAQLTDEAGELAPDTSQAYYDDAGNLIEPKNPEVEIKPPYVDGSTPIPGQMWSENSDGTLAALTKVERYMLDNYGLKAAEKFDGSQIKKLKTLLTEGKDNAAGRITEGMAIADKVGKEWRDFALLPYGETKNFDLALSYMFPYQFWYSRSYANWMKRVATEPQVIANYARLKETMSRVNKDSPEWWRYNVEIPSHFLGLPNEHPMSFNLEANLWPLYGLTGTDFNDPQKRQNWATSTIDDVGKFGPSMWAGIQWGVALAYRAKGEEEMAQAWAGRAIPQTATIKAVSSYFGQPVELDPMIQMFSGKGLMDFSAMDKYERNRVGRALAAMVQEGTLTDEQMTEVARTQEGPEWDEAVRRATKIRAPGQIMSYLGGVGMKARTEEDRITDEFYQQYYRLNNMNEAGLISPQDYQQSWDGLREKYPFMDALLLSRKAGPDRDRAYAYNVLGRVPPGQASELYKLVGIDAKLAQKFYDTKGDISGMSESEKDKFMAAMVDMGAMIAIPEYADKTEWNAARNSYKQVTEGMKQNFGAEIQDKIDHYFSIEDGNQKKRFMEMNPDVAAAMDWQKGQIVNNGLLMEFYGGIETLEKYHKGKMYDELEKQFGADISKTWDEYYLLQMIDPKGAKAFKKKHPEMDKYSKAKKVLQEQTLRTIVEFGARLPEPDPLDITENEPQSVAQSNIQEYANQTTPGFDYWQNEMPEVSELLQEYWYGGEKLPYAVEKQLDNDARQYGYQSGDQLLQAILISMEQSQPMGVQR